MATWLLRDERLNRAAVSRCLFCATIVTPWAPLHTMCWGSSASRAEVTTQEGPSHLSRVSALRIESKSLCGGDRWGLVVEEEDLV